MLSAVKTLFLLVLTAILISGCDQGAAKPPEKRFQKVTSTFGERRKAELCRQIDRRFENPQAHFELAQLYYADGLYNKAEYEYNVTLGFDPVHREAQAGLIRLLQQMGNQEKSKIAAELYMSQAASSAEGSFKLGVAFQKLGLDDYALRCYQQALNLAPKSAAINKQIGYFYLGKNDTGRAVEYLKHSFQLNPYQPEVAGELGRLGVVIQIPRRTGTSVRKLDRALQSTPTKR